MTKARSHLIFRRVKVKAGRVDSNKPRDTPKTHSTFMRSVQEMWECRRWPIRNGIYYADDTVQFLEVSMPWETEFKTISIQPTRRVRLDEFDLQTNLTTVIGADCESSDADLNLRLFGGGGAHGSEGFVSVADSNSGLLLWLLYLDCSNPFEKVSLFNGSVRAVTNLFHVWTLPLYSPEALTVDFPTRDN
jgi:hypothetical protein